LRASNPHNRGGGSYEIMSPRGHSVTYLRVGYGLKQYDKTS